MPPFTSSHAADMPGRIPQPGPQSKWSRRFWADLAERVGSTAVGGAITMLTADASGVVSGDAQQWWVIVGLPAALAALKGLAANLSDAESGASLLPAPPEGPGPEVMDDDFADDGGVWESDSH